MILFGIFLWAISNGHPIVAALLFLRAFFGGSSNGRK